MTHAIVTDHAVLRYLQSAYGLDVEAVRQHIAGRAATAVELGAIAVKIDGVKLLLRGAYVISAVPPTVRPRWPGDRT